MHEKKENQGRDNIDVFEREREREREERAMRWQIVRQLETWLYSIEQSLQAKQIT